MRPERYASRPASQASFIARAIPRGSFAEAMAVFSSTPSQPSSVANDTSLAIGGVRAVRGWWSQARWGIPGRSRRSSWRALAGENNYGTGLNLVLGSPDGLLRPRLGDVARALPGRVDHPPPLAGEPLLDAERQRFPVGVDHHVQVTAPGRAAVQAVGQAVGVGAQV